MLPFRQRVVMMASCSRAALLESGAGSERTHPAVSTLATRRSDGRLSTILPQFFARE
jgi:hypothetical protein